MNISEFGLEKSAFSVYWGAELLPCGSLKKRIKEESLVKFTGRTDKMQAKLFVTATMASADPNAHCHTREQTIIGE